MSALGNEVPARRAALPIRALELAAQPHPDALKPASRRRGGGCLRGLMWAVIFEGMSAAAIAAVAWGYLSLAR